MSSLEKWRRDALLGRVLRNSTHLFSSNGLSLALGFAQGILAVRLLGADGNGLLGIIMGYASTVNSLLSFRMSELVVRYAGEFLERGEKQRAGALVKAAGLTEAAVSGLAFLAVAATASLAETLIAKTPGSARLFVFYALGLLANFNYETSIGILQITDKIRLQGILNLVQSLFSAALIVAAFLLHGSLPVVLGAYLLGKTILGLGVFAAAQIQLRRALGAGWARASFALLPPRGALIRFALSSNFSATVIRIFRESEILWVGFFLSTAAAGYYRVAYTLIGLLSVPADPLIATVYPELNRLIVQQAWARVRDFLRKVTTVAFAYNLILGLGMIVFGRWILSIYGEQYASAYPALLALLAGMAFNYTLFWNRPLLLSLGLPAFPLLATLAAGLLKIGLAFPLVPRYGYAAEAGLLSFYYIFSVGLIVWRGMRELRRRETGL